MPAAAADFTIGVEEEYQMIDPEMRALRPCAARVLPRAREDLGDEVTNEFFLSQIEIGTPVCHSLAEVRAELIRLRRGVIEAARRDDSRIAAAGTHPFFPLGRAGRHAQTALPRTSRRLPAKLYWDARPSSHAETLEFRMADVCPTVDEDARARQ